MSARRERGFSLVEVSLAIAIISFCLLTMLGLLPAGLGALREAGEQTAQAQIVQQIAGRVRLMSTREKLDEFTGKEHFYGEDGLELPGPTPGTLYKVALKEAASPVYPGSASLGSLTNSLAVIGIFIRSQSTGFGPTNSYVIHVPRPKEAN